VTAPLILTLALDPASQGFFARERQRWFPPSRNLIPAHVTLFHHLSGDDLPRVQDDLARLCAAEKATAFTVDGVRSLGRGVAYTPCTRLQSRLFGPAWPRRGRLA